METGFTKTTNQAIETTVHQAIRDKTFPGVELFVAKGKTILYHNAFGHVDSSENSPLLFLNSIFDLASLTKPLATAPAVVSLAMKNRLSFEDRVVSYIPEFDGPIKSKITISHLLTHSSGLPAWEALFEPNFDKIDGWRKLLSLQLEESPDQKVIYSCLGYILLGEIVRRVTGISLTEYCQTALYNPLGLSELQFRPKPDNPRLVPTAYCPYRKKTLRGVVHDENAYIFDEEGGNAGLFGTCQQIHQFCLSLLGENDTDNSIFNPESVRELFLEPQTKIGLPPRTYGWDVHSGTDDYMSCGDLMSVGSVGHLGFTGTSLWIDRKTGVIVIVLSNRVNLSREANLPLMRAFRPKIHNLLLQEVIPN